CPLFGSKEKISVPLLVSVEGIRAQSLVLGGKIVPIVGVSGRNSVPLLVSVGGIVLHHWCQWGNSAPSLILW
ncbi:unnamed protein product, partial [Staurois parvus]